MLPVAMVGGWLAGHQVNGCRFPKIHTQRSNPTHNFVPCWCFNILGSIHFSARDEQAEIENGGELALSERESPTLLPPA